MSVTVNEMRTRRVTLSDGRRRGGSACQRLEEGLGKRDHILASSNNDILLEADRAVQLTFLARPGGRGEVFVGAGSRTLDEHQLGARADNLLGHIVNDTLLGDVGQSDRRAGAGGGDQVRLGELGGGAEVIVQRLQIVVQLGQALGLDQCGQAGVREEVLKVG